LRSKLESWLADEIGEPVTISELTRTSAGFSRENWVFDGTWAGTRHDLIARRDPVGSVLNTDRKVEAAVLRSLAGTKVRVPTLRWADLEGRRLGRPTPVSASRSPSASTTSCRPSISSNGGSWPSGTP
jgi:aminoglycoside phosphotransferase (APT) family kinase protein